MDSYDFDKLVQKQRAAQQSASRDAATAADSESELRRADAAEFQQALSGLAKYLAARQPPTAVKLAPPTKWYRTAPTSPPGWLLSSGKALGRTSALVLLADGRLYRYSQSYSSNPSENGIVDTESEFLTWGWCDALGASFQRHRSRRGLTAFHSGGDSGPAVYETLEDHLASIAVRVLR